jgi:hypothetical protein
MGPSLLLTDNFLVLIMPSDPEPNVAVLRFNCQSAISKVTLADQKSPTFLK